MLISGNNINNSVYINMKSNIMLVWYEIWLCMMDVRMSNYISSGDVFYIIEYICTG